MTQLRSRLRADVMTLPGTQTDHEHDPAGRWPGDRIGQVSPHASQPLPDADDGS